MGVFRSVYSDVMSSAISNNSPFSCVLALCFFLPMMCATPAAAEDLFERLRETRLTNLEDVIEAAGTDSPGSGAFLVKNPYSSSDQPDATPRDGTPSSAVCAVRFADDDPLAYALGSFPSIEEMETSGAILTHFGRCGSCSTLSDLAVYLEQPDLTTPARRCSRKSGAVRIKRCFVEQIGFTEACAESWTYNAINTRDRCRDPCVKTYGALNLLLHRYPAPNNLPDGSLNACLQCDEDLSGPGFKQSAGRTRRNSGIPSAIERQDSEFRPVDHAAYFKNRSLDQD